MANHHEDVDASIPLSQQENGGSRTHSGGLAWHSFLPIGSLCLLAGDRRPSFVMPGRRATFTSQPLKLDLAGQPGLTRCRLARPRGRTRATRDEQIVDLGLRGAP